MISAKVIEDTLNVPANVRITTYECVVPKWLIAEINTHRMLARNSASSRAVPTKTIIERVKSDPYIPLEWRYRNPEGGMQAGELMSEEDAEKALDDWLFARDAVLEFVEDLEGIKTAKEHVNRLMEPWMWTTVVMTATEWDNYFQLRGPDGGAQPEFKALVAAQIEARKESYPRRVFGMEGYHERETDLWHLPYITADERFQYRPEILPRLSAARCARVSYFRQGEQQSIQKELERCDSLIENGHWSPLEMPCRIDPDGGWYGPFRGWKPFRKFFGGESGSETHGTQYSEKEWVNL